MTREPQQTLALAAAWLSPAALLGLGPVLLGDGTRGLWAALALAGGALVAVFLLADPWSRYAAAASPRLVDVARVRWPSAQQTLRPLAVGELGTGLLFLWAQLAAEREIGRALGWSPTIAIGGTAFLLLLAACRDTVGAAVAALGGALALVGLVVPLAGVLTATSPWWPRVWGEVASRPRVVFSDRGVWTTHGRPIRSAGPDATVVVTEEQRVALPQGGRVRVEPWDGGGTWHEVSAGAELTLKPGDRLTVPNGLLLRFQADRRIPGAPPSGADWVDPRGRRAGWLTLVGVGVTLAFGGLGLPAVHGSLPARVQSARAGAALVVLGIALATLWGLYTAWLTPEVYIAGIAGVEVYELPDGVTDLGILAWPLRNLALVGLAAGGLAAGLSALRAGSRGAGERSSRVPMLLGMLLGPSALALVAPARPWVVLLASFGLAAAVGAPAALLACWSERVTARSVAIGSTLGLLLFVGLGLLGLSGIVAVDDPSAPSWLGGLAAWPAVVALPVNALIAWYAGSRPAPTPRSPLSPGLAELHGER